MKNSQSQPIVQLTRNGNVGIITITRPARKNALNLEIKNSLISLLEEAEADLTISTVVLTGSNGYFVAGTDIEEMASMSPSDHVKLDTDRIFHVLRLYSKPTIAAIEGYALGGGCELALACDIIIASEDALFGQPEIRVGIMPGAGGTQKLLRTAGRYKTLLWTLIGNTISAKDAYTANFVSELTPTGHALTRSLEIALQISKMPPLAVQAIRDVVRLGGDMSLESALSLERRYFERLFDSIDQKEGMNAFLEKRPPVYKGT